MKDAHNPLHGDADLHAFVDGRLAAAERAAVQARLDADPDAATQVREWQEQRAALRGLHAQLLQEAVPASLLAAARQVERRNSRAAHWQRWGGIAASLVLAFGIGWGTHGQWSRRDAAGAAVARAGLVSSFGHDALVAHAVYSPEVRHPVEVDAQQQEHLVQWLSKRLNRPLKIPHLTQQGYELVGGRLLPGGQGARAQFMYQNARGERVTLYVGALDAKGAAPAPETAFRFTSQGDVSTFYWVDEGFGYALAGKLPRSSLLALSESVYRQL